MISLVSSMSFGNAGVLSLKKCPKRVERRDARDHSLFILIDTRASNSHSTQSLRLFPP